MPFFLPPGHIMIFKYGKPRLSRYWFPETIPIDSSITFVQAVSHFLTLFKEAIRCRLRSDYPIGFELSGGVDSSSVVCTAHTLGFSTDRSVYINRFGSYHCDEGYYNDAVVQKITMPHYAFRADQIDYVNDYPLAFPYRFNQDWPIFATYTQKFPLVRLMHLNGIRVVLTEQGGDQVLTGNYYMLSDLLRSFRWITFFRYGARFGFTKKKFLNTVSGNHLLTDGLACFKVCPTRNPVLIIPLFL